MRFNVWRFALLLGVAGCASLTGRGQNVLLAKHGGKMLPVVKAWRHRALVEVGDKLVVADEHVFALRHVDEFLPMFVAVSHLEVSTHALELIDTGSLVNNEFWFRASFSSPYEIKDAFLVLELHLAKGEKALFLNEIGDLGPQRPHFLRLAVPLGFPLGEGNYTLHIFSGGLELLHSEQPFAFRERALDRIVAKHLPGLPDGPPKPLFGPTPEYPGKLAKAKLTGAVLVHCTVRANGAVADPVVKSATDPAFGEAALTAVRLWRFIPRIKNGRPTDTAVDLPLSFAPPAKS